MNITSILITIVGIIFIIALYLMSRITRSKLPKTQATLIPEIKDDNGDNFTSVLDDIPARDGITTQAKESTAPKENSSVKQNDSNNDTVGIKQQIVLFVSAKDGNSLDGNLVKQALEKNGLVFGDKDIYHYFDKSSTNSLFRIANGVEPWTLTEKDLANKKVAGLSIVMLLPAKINDREAIKILFSTAEKLSTDVKGVLKNQQQQILTQTDKNQLLNK